MCYMQRDMAISPCAMRRHGCRYQQVASLARQNKLVVVPTFETEDLALAYDVAAGGKEVRQTACHKTNATYSCTLVAISFFHLCYVCVSVA